MLFMKVEKDNACDRVDVCEEQCKAARVSFFSPFDFTFQTHCNML